MNTPEDAIDFREITDALRRGWRWIGGGVLAGLLIAGALAFLLPESYEGRATVLLRDRDQVLSSSQGASRSSLLELLSTPSAFETELEILTSRTMLGAVVDSLGLQARIVEPRPMEPSNVFASLAFSSRVREGRYSFRHEPAAGAYRISGPGESGTVRPGERFELGGATLVLRDGRLPEEFTVALSSRAKAIDRLEKRLEADRSGGDVAEVLFRARDAHTAATVPNLLVRSYIEDRRDRNSSVLRQRIAYLTMVTDSIRGEVTSAGRALRTYQETAGTVDPSRSGELARVFELRGEMDRLTVEANGLERLLSTAESGDLTTSQLASFPTFLETPGMNDVLSRILDLRSERRALLERRTPQDPDVLVLDQNIAALEEELLELARGYYGSVVRQQAQVSEELRRYAAAVGGRQEESLPLQSEFERLLETETVLETQLVQARLAAFDELGDLRQVDVAVPPEDPVFPNPLIFLALGLVGGALLGTMGALGQGFLGERLHNARQAELAAGVPAVALRPKSPFLLGGTDQRRTVLVVPVGDGADAPAVAERIAETASLRGIDVAVFDVDAGAMGGNGAGSGRSSLPARVGDSPTGVQPSLRAHLSGLEERHGLVVAALEGLHTPATAAVLDPSRAVVLVARAGVARRAELQESVEALARFGVEVAGVILQEADEGG